MPKPPSTASSSASSSSSTSLPVLPETGSTRDTPLNPPRPLFFLERKNSAQDIEDVRRDPFRSPEPSVPSTPRSIVSNPFSAPSSVINLSGDQHVTIASGTNVDPSHSRPQSSRVSVHSSLRTSTTELNIREVRSGLTSRVHSQIRDSFMSPPTIPRRATFHDSNAASRVSVAGHKYKRSRSTMLTGKVDKPWIGEKDVYALLAYCLTYGIGFLGVVGSVILCYFGWRNVPRVGNLCLIMEDNFDKFDTDFTWEHEVDMGGFGTGEFEMTTNSPNNSFVRDGHLYIVPTLTSDVIGKDAIFNGYTFNITGCTNTNTSACGAVSNETTADVINPVMSARIHTKRSHHIQYGKVEVRAKIPRGDWLWPSIWMLPVTEKYGPWPRSGEIDIMEARGNSPEYKGQGVDVVRGQLNWGPFPWLNGVSKTFGFWSDRRKSYADSFHTYAMEWTPEFMRLYVDSRLHATLDIRFKIPFFERGDFPETVANGSQWIVTPNPWEDASNAAPFDQPFYLVMDVAVGGTTGWFPDGLGDKPWLDGSLTAMRDFAKAQDQWYANWPQNIEDRALVVDSVKMWQSC